MTLWLNKTDFNVTHSDGTVSLAPARPFVVVARGAIKIARGRIGAVA
jgi:hypothetical protein